MTDHEMSYVVAFLENLSNHCDDLEDGNIGVSLPNTLENRRLVEAAEKVVWEEAGDEYGGIRLFVRSSGKPKVIGTSRHWLLLYLIEKLKAEFNVKETTNVGNE